jgi:hypothetical protein
VALLLPSGRSLTAALRRQDDEGAYVLELPSVPALPAGERVELRWEESGGWCSLAGRVAPSREAGADRGRLRVEQAGDAVAHRERRRRRRLSAALRIDVQVLRGAGVMPGTELATWVEDATADGLAFDAELQFEPGDELRLVVRGEDGAPLGRATAHVARVERPPGALHHRVGVVVDDAPADVLTLLRRGGQ